MALRLFFNSARNPFIRNGFFNQSLTSAPSFFLARRNLNVYNSAIRRFASNDGFTVLGDGSNEEAKRRFIENVKRMADCENYSLEKFLKLSRVEKRYKGKPENAEADWKIEKYKKRLADIQNHPLKKFLKLPSVKERYNDLEKAEDDWKRTRELHEAMGIPKIY